jgi:hypothetical protein
MNVQKLNIVSPKHEKHTYQLYLSIGRVPTVEEGAKPERIELLRTTSFGTRFGKESFDGDWHPDDDRELNSMVLLAPVESLTEEQYRKFFRVIVPTPDGLLEGFSGEKIPSLDRIKRSFPFPWYYARAVCWRLPAQVNKD